MFVPAFDGTEDADVTELFSVGAGTQVFAGRGTLESIFGANVIGFALRPDDKLAYCLGWGRATTHRGNRYCRRLHLHHLGDDQRTLCGKSVVAPPEDTHGWQVCRKCAVLAVKSRAFRSYAAGNFDYTSPERLICSPGGDAELINAELVRATITLPRKAWETLCNLAEGSDKVGRFLTETLHPEHTADWEGQAEEEV